MSIRPYWNPSLGTTDYKLFPVLGHWLGTAGESRSKAEGTVGEGTLKRYEYAIRPHIKPVLGRIKLKSLTTAHVRRFYCEKLDAGLAPATVLKMHAVLHKAPMYAVLTSAS